MGDNSKCPVFLRGPQPNPHPHPRKFLAYFCPQVSFLLVPSCAKRAKRLSGISWWVLVGGSPGGSPDGPPRVYIHIYIYVSSWSKKKCAFARVGSVFSEGMFEGSFPFCSRLLYGGTKSEKPYALLCFIYVARESERARERERL